MAEATRIDGDRPQEPESSTMDSALVDRSTGKPMPGRLVAGIVAWLILFFSLVLAYIPRPPSTVFQSDWPAEIPRDATEFRGWPFIDGFGRSVAHQRGSWVGHYTHAPGLAANWAVAILNAIATFFVIDRMRKFDYRVSLNSVFSVMTSIAIALALLSNQEAIDTQLVPTLGLMRSHRPPDPVAISSYCIGQCCLCTVLGFSLVQSVTVIFSPPTKRS